MTYVIVNEQKEQVLKHEFATFEDAYQHLEEMGSFFAKRYRPYFTGFADENCRRMLNEGMTKGDLDGILLPKVSVDEYVPGDPNTDNVVIAFFIKGVPEAIIPFRNYVMYCDGVLDVDYGDSETLPNTSVVYCEFDRENLVLGHIHEMIVEVGLIANLETSDFTLTFPHTNKKFPYHTKFLKQYFDSRTRKQNAIAQRKAEKLEQEEEAQRVKDLEKAAQDDQGDNDGESVSEADKRLAAYLSDLLFESDDDTTVLYRRKD